MNRDLYRLWMSANNIGPENEFQFTARDMRILEILREAGGPVGTFRISVIGGYTESQVRAAVLKLSYTPWIYEDDEGKLYYNTGAEYEKLPA